VAAPQPAVFDSVIIAGRNPAFLFAAFLINNKLLDGYAV
jgi:hypothetical protein